ncbi:MAG: hypothetical protein COT73_09125 [Bdellovibrio sp. CG10_big_fil_rev_8_21_14_0_10_47_8]|nr:MAG: hypothetical protein COT73_09125 [Bdellovibrio sp. CG10_big_fil_rev_8_21_14_0_10_47_8]
MTGVRYNFLNLAILLLTTLLFSGFQTTFWFQIFGSLPSPQLWLNLILYLILFRSRLEGIFTIYLLGLTLNPFTAMPLGILWLNLMLIFGLMTFIKKRVFWPTSRYFFMASLGVGFIYHVSYFLISRLFESNPAPVLFFHRFFEILFTALTAIPIYTFMTWVDRFTGKEILPESAGGDS